MIRTAIAVVTYNAWDVAQRCLSSWRPPGTILGVWDNGSSPAMQAWLRDQPSIDWLVLRPNNEGLCVGRNRLIEWARALPAEYVLLLDSDVILYPWALEPMVRVLDQDPRAGAAVYPQAVKGLTPLRGDYVEEAANECMLTRLSMWRLIGLFPECQFYYSGDSWKSTMANMHGLRTKVVVNHGAGYLHVGGGGQSKANRDVEAHKLYDCANWEDADRSFEAYWRARLTHGKGTQAMWDAYEAEMATFRPDLRRNPSLQEFWEATAADTNFRRNLP